MNKEVKVWLFLVTWVIVGLSPVMVAAMMQQPKEEVMLDETEDVLRFDMEDVEVKSEEIIINDAGIKLYNVPLPEAEQIHTFQLCDGHSIAPAIPLAIMDVESDFIADAVSPNGAIGIMQVVPEWHQGRMEKLGCTDLFDPYQNITVGIDYLAELKDMNPDIVWVLTAYRYGPDKAEEKINSGDIDYALAVLERAHELEVEYGSNR